MIGSCITLMSVRFDPPGAPDYYPGFNTAAIRRSSISRNKYLPGTHLLHLGGVCGGTRTADLVIDSRVTYPLDHNTSTIIGRNLPNYVYSVDTGKAIKVGLGRLSENLYERGFTLEKLKVITVTLFA